MASTSRADVTAVILTFNEERNLAACLESLVDWVAQVFVVDSGSTDRTVAIAEQLGATVVTPIRSKPRASVELGAGGAADNERIGCSRSTPINR
jgi:glycosyltransferase involved in cell wall biosynthesis